MLINHLETKCCLISSYLGSGRRPLFQLKAALRACAYLATAAAVADPQKIWRPANAGLLY